MSSTSNHCETNDHESNRRTFVKTTAAGVALAGFQTSLAAGSSSSAMNQLTCAVMGVNGRGSALARGFARQKDVVVSFDKIEGLPHVTPSVTSFSK